MAIDPKKALGAQIAGGEGSWNKDQGARTIGELRGLIVSLIRSINSPHRAHALNSKWVCVIAHQCYRLVPPRLE